MLYICTCAAFTASLSAAAPSLLLFTITMSKSVFDTSAVETLTAVSPKLKMTGNIRIFLWSYFRMLIYLI